MSDTTVLVGIFIVAIGGLVMGGSPTPLKFMRQFKYEQFGFISMLIALLIIPWSITLVSCPNVLDALGEIDKGILIKGNIFSVGWGVAQILAMLCFLRIGVSLTYGILCGVGACIGVITPMVFKASGVFSSAPNLISKAGLIVLCGVVVMVVGVFFASLAGFGRERLLKETEQKTKIKSGSFGIGLIMVIISGILSTGWGFAFNYSQGPIIESMKAHGAKDFPAKIAVWAFVLFGAALVNVLYPAYLMSKNKSWNVLLNNHKEIILSGIYGLLFFIPSVLLGHGSLMLGALGASVGWGIIQGSLIVGGQTLGFISGEWRGITGKPRIHIYLAIIILIISMVILAFGNSFV